MDGGPGWADYESVDTTTLGYKPQLMYHLDKHRPGQSSAKTRILKCSQPGRVETGRKRFMCTLQLLLATVSRALCRITLLPATHVLVDTWM